MWWYGTNIQYCWNKLIAYLTAISRVVALYMDRFHCICVFYACIRQEYITYLLQFHDKICGVPSLLSMIVTNIDLVQVFYEAIFDIHAV